MALRYLFAYWRSLDGNHPLVALATGLGKSFLIAELVRRFLAEGRRILIVTHQEILLKQDATAIKALWPEAPVRFNCAGLRQRCTSGPLILASVQSVWRYAKEIGHIDLLIVDEAHRIPRKGTGQYRTLIWGNDKKGLVGLKQVNPGLRIVAMTATPFRLESGRLDEGKDALFDGIAFEYGIGEGVGDGWLAPLVSKKTDTEFDVSAVKVRGGEFVEHELEKAVNRGALVNSAADEIVAWGAERRKWLVFCTGINHSINMRDALRDRGISAETVTSVTPRKERERIIADYRAGKIQALAGCDIFTTGFDVPDVDLIALLRPMMSTGLYVQMCGRGSRKAEGKKDCLILDFAGNIFRHGPVDRVRVTVVQQGGEGTGAANAAAVRRTRTCPQCKTIMAHDVFRCECRFEWPGREVKHNHKADTNPVLGVVPQWINVSGLTAQQHRRKGASEDDPPTLRVDYRNGLQTYSEYLAFEHEGYARRKAAQKWFELGGRTPIPKTVAEAHARSRELGIAQILVRKDEKYWQVLAHRRAAA
jgi:DNA repair protein RadD